MRLILSVCSKTSLRLLFVVPAVSFLPRAGTPLMRLMTHRLNLCYLTMRVITPETYLLCGLVISVLRLVIYMVLVVCLCLLLFVCRFRVRTPLMLLMWVRFIQWVFLLLVPIRVKALVLLTIRGSTKTCSLNYCKGDRYSRGGPGLCHLLSTLRSPIVMVRFRSLRSLGTTRRQLTLFGLVNLVVPKKL